MPVKGLTVAAMGHAGVPAGGNRDADLDARRLAELPVTANGVAPAFARSDSENDVPPCACPMLDAGAAHHGPSSWYSCIPAVERVVALAPSARRDMSRGSGLEMMTGGAVDMSCREGAWA